MIPFSSPVSSLARVARVAVGVLCSVIFTASFTAAQVSVTTYHNDNARTGQNTQETILTPANVNSSQFGKVFATAVDGYVYAQPLYVPNVANIAGGTHNVLYVATEHDSLYALDADSGAVLWQKSFINAGAGITTASSGDVACSDLVPEVGITSTPVIDPATNTLYLVAKTKENGSYFQRIHAIDIVTNAEKFGGPITIAGSVTGTGDGNVGGIVSFDPLKEHNRPGLLLQNGHVVIAWASHCDNGPYHGWVMSYNAGTLAQEAVFSTNPNGGLDGIWMSGDGLATDASGNIYFATGNGTYDGAASNDYGDSVIKLSGPTGGFAVTDWFTPFNQGSLNGGDTDVGSGGVLVLPDLPVGSAHQHLLVQMGKEGKIYLLDRDNMGKFCSTCTSVDTQIVQEIPGATTGIWGSPAYWNGSVYWGGGNDGGSADRIKAFSFNANSSGLLSTSPTSQSSQTFGFSTAAPVISANGTNNGIVWVLDNSSFNSACCQILYAFDATNLGTMLYNSNQATANRDQSGGSVKFTAPIVANGKVYAGSQGKVTAWGPITTTPVTATPTFTPAPGSYSSGVSVTLADTTTGASIYYTTDGSTPTTSSTKYAGAIAVNATTTVKAIAAAAGFNNSAVAGGTYTISSGSSGINYGSGFSATGLALNGSAALSGTRLRLTNGGGTEAGSAFFTTPVNVTNFTNDFSFQMTTAVADGMTFTIQNTGTTALGPTGGGLGYGPDTTTGTGGIPKSIAVKFDIYSNAGEGTDSTGLYLNGVSPTTPFVDMTSSGVTLLNGDVFNAHMTYDGTTLKMTLTDATTNATFSNSWAVNIPSTVGANTAFVGFTGGTGGATAIQDVITWTYTTSASVPPAATPTFSPAPGTYTSAQSVTLSDTTAGATIYYTTDGSTPTTSSKVYTAAIPVAATTTIKAIAAASGFTTSGVATGVYTINVPVAATPTLSPAPGTYTSAQFVTLSDSTAGATIYYTTDGTTPTTSSKVYTAAISVAATTTIKAIASASGFTTSGVATGVYTIGIVTKYEAESTPVTGSPNTRVFAWGGFSGGNGVIADGTAVGAFLQFTVNVPQPGKYDVRFATKQFTTRAIVQASVNGVNVGAAQDEYNANGNGVFAEYDAGTVVVSTAGNYTFKFTAVGHNAGSSGYTVVVDYIKLTSQ